MQNSYAAGTGPLIFHRKEGRALRHITVVPPNRLNNRARRAAAKQAQLELSRAQTRATPKWQYANGATALEGRAKIMWLVDRGIRHNPFKRK